MTSSNNDYDPFGKSRKASREGVERQIADQEIARREAQLYRDRPGVTKYSQAQEHPGLTYDPELLGVSTRVMSGAEYDELVKREAVAAKYRYETERAVQAKRADLLVPLESPKPVETQTSTPQPTATPTPS